MRRSPVASGRITHFYDKFLACSRLGADLKPDGCRKQLHTVGNSYNIALSTTCKAARNAAASLNVTTIRLIYVF
jgi:hypothetical protein